MNRNAFLANQLPPRKAMWGEVYANNGDKAFTITELRVVGYDGDKDAFIGDCPNATHGGYRIPRDNFYKYWEYIPNWQPRDISKIEVKSEKNPFRRWFKKFL